MVQKNLFSLSALMAWCLTFMLSCSSAFAASPNQQLPSNRFETRASLERHAQQLLKNHPGLDPQSKIELIFGDIPPELPLCRDASTYIPSNPSKILGTIQIAIRCQTPQSWLFSITAKIKKLQKYWILSTDLPAGTILTGQEFSEGEAWSDQIPHGAINDLSFAVGKTLKQNTAKGTMVTTSMLKAEPVVLVGQSVKIVASGSGFKITTTGRALSPALPGQPVRVKMPNGQIVSGTATTGGTVEVMKP
jgi:flagella basal body P-ring formation protein FlgA